MARWVVSTNDATQKASLLYVGGDRVVQDCGTCESGLMSQLLEWMFSPGQVDPYDIIEIDGREFVALDERLRA